MRKITHLHLLCETGSHFSTLQMGASLQNRGPSEGAGVYYHKTTETRKHSIALLHGLGQNETAVQLEATQTGLERNEGEQGSI